MSSIKLPNEVARLLAGRLRDRRIEHNWSREELSRRSGVTIASIRRFETTSEISLTRFLKLCFTLHALVDFQNLLKPSPPTTIAQIESQLKQKKRQRARRKS